MKIGIYSFLSTAAIIIVMLAAKPFITTASAFWVNKPEIPSSLKK